MTMSIWIKIPILHRKLSETLTPRLSLLSAGVFAHEVGRMRSMDTPGPRETNVQGVVDTNLLVQVHGFDVCDLSVFPYSPQLEANPTLILAAISMRLADHLHSESMMNIDEPQLGLGIMSLFFLRVVNYNHLRCLRTLPPPLLVLRVEDLRSIYEPFLSC
jgi:hypothetical protein